MKSLIYAVIFTFLFVVFGLHINSEIQEFTDIYISRAETIKTYIKKDDWENTRIELEKYHKDFYQEKERWYKILHHEYFDNICLYLDILDNSVFCKDKSMSLEQLVHIRKTLNNILESEKCDLNHIF